MSPDERTRGAGFEPLYEALEEAAVVKKDDPGGPRASRRGLLWKLFWFGLLFFGLLALALEQST